MKRKIQHNFLNTTQAMYVYKLLYNNDIYNNEKDIYMT